MVWFSAMLLVLAVCFLRGVEAPPPAMNGGIRCSAIFRAAGKNIVSPQTTERNFLLSWDITAEDTTEEGAPCSICWYPLYQEASKAYSVPSERRKTTKSGRKIPLAPSLRGPFRQVMIFLATKRRRAMQPTAQRIIS